MPSGSESHIFRQEAVQHHVNQRVDGHALRISPGWSRWVFRLLVASLLTLLVYVTTSTMYEYASGPAVIRIEGRTDVTASTGGTIAEVIARPGQRVNAGDPLVRLEVRREHAELDSVHREFELQLVKILRNPADYDARSRLSSLRAQRELAKTHLEAKTLRAERSGVVSDVRLRAGQRVNPGDLVLTMVSNDAPCSVLAMTPARYRPLLRKGMTLRLELSGFRYAYTEARVLDIGDEVIGPGEVRRFLGAELADTVPVDGPVVLVRAELPSNQFEADGELFNYYDGMPGKADVRVRTASILVTLIPGLKWIFGGGNRG